MRFGRGWVSFLLVTTAVSGRPADAPPRAPRVDVPADLGPATIDVSSYPAEMQNIYRTNFLKNCAVCHSPARAVNSEFLELPAAEIATLRAESPALFDDPRVLLTGPDLWKRYIKRMKMRPPCCGVCPVMTEAEARDIWRFLVFDGRARKTGARANLWVRERRDLLQKFQKRFPERYRDLYETPKEESQ